MFKSVSIRKVLVLALFITVFASASLFAEYDQDHVVRVMRDNVGLMGEINGAAQAEDWVLAAQKLFALSEGMLDIMVYDPPRGSKADWDTTMMAFVNAAYIGIGACGAQDAEALQKAVGTLRQLNRQGHGAHK